MSKRRLQGLVPRNLFKPFWSTLHAPRERGSYAKMEGYYGGAVQFSHLHPSRVTKLGSYAHARYIFVVTRFLRQPFAFFLLP